MSNRHVQRTEAAATGPKTTKPITKDCFTSKASLLRHHDKTATRTGAHRLRHYENLTKREAAAPATPICPSRCPRHPTRLLHLVFHVHGLARARPLQHGHEEPHGRCEHVITTTSTSLVRGLRTCYLRPAIDKRRPRRPGYIKPP